MTSPGLVTLTLCSRCQAVSAWIGKAAAMSRRMASGIGISRSTRRHALIGEAARLLRRRPRRGRRPSTPSTPGPSAATRPEISRPATIG